MAGKANIQVEGVRNTVRALKEFEPDLYKQMGKSIRASMRQLRDAASSNRPQGVYKSSFRMTARKGPTGTVSLVTPPRDRNDWSDPSVRTAIFEFAGTRSPGKNPGIRAAIQSFDQRYRKPGRFLWAAYDEIGGQVEGDIERAIRDAERTLQGNIDAGRHG